MKSWKPYLARLAVFLLLVFTVVPAAIYSYGINPQIKVRMMFMPLAILGTAAAFTILKRDELKIFHYTFSWKQAFLFAIFAYTQFILYIFQQNTWLPSKYNDAIVLIGGLYYFGGSLLLFLSIFQLDFFKHFFKPVLLSFITIFLYIVLSLIILLVVGPLLAKLTTMSVAWLLSFTNKVTTEYYTPLPLLGADGFFGSIGAACTGIVSLVLFSGLFLFIGFLDWEKLKKHIFILVYVFGAVGMFIVATMRTYLLFLIGANWSPAFANRGFHTNAGWIFFVLYFLIYLWFTYPLMLAKRDRNV